jgi:hypothetical protein
MLPTRIPSPRGRRRLTLSQILRRLVWSFSLAILGSWGLIVPRLRILDLDAAGRSSPIWLYLDIFFLFLAIFGVFMAIYQNSRLSPRLARLSQLGESQW